MSFAERSSQRSAARGADVRSGAEQQEVSSPLFSMPPGYWAHYGIQLSSDPSLDGGAFGMPAGYLEHYGIQRKGEATQIASERGIHDVAQSGFAGGGGTLPYLDTIQRSFGEHDVSGVRAYVGGPAAEASRSMGALAYAAGDSVAFREQPSLHTAAHEAAHIVQQRSGLKLDGGVGREGDTYEVQADRVADRVVAGQSAADLLGPTSGARGNSVQRKVDADSPIQLQAAQSQAPGGAQTYTVARGDTLTGIAARFHTTAAELARVNQITDANRLRVGQTLRLPAATNGTRANAPTNTPSQGPQGQTPHSTGGTPQTAPAGQTPATAPQGQTPAATPQGQTPATTGPQGQTPQAQGTTPATTPGGQTPANQTPANGDTRYDQAALATLAAQVVAVAPQDTRDHATTAIPTILAQSAARGVRDGNQVAYILATAQHETRFGTPRYQRSQSMVEDHNPYRQTPNGQFTATDHVHGRTVTGATEQQVDNNYWDAAYGGRLGNQRGTDDAANYRGRGFVQLTGRTNYENMTQTLTGQGFTYTVDGQTYGGQGNPPIDLAAHPDHVNRVPELAARIEVTGMQNGSFTGRPISQYVNAQQQDFTNARSVINGDTAENGATIAGYAQTYAAVLNAGNAWANIFNVPVAADQPAQEGGAPPTNPAPATPH